MPRKRTYPRDESPSRPYACGLPCNSRFKRESDLKHHRALKPACRARDHARFNAIYDEEEAVDPADEFLRADEPPQSSSPIGQHLLLNDFAEDFGMDIDGIGESSGDLNPITAGPGPPNAPLDADADVEHPILPAAEPSQTAETVVDSYPEAGKVYGTQQTRYEKIRQQQDARDAGLYWPFSCATEAEMAAFLHESSMSLAEVDVFLRTSYVR